MLITKFHATTLPLSIPYKLLALLPQPINLILVKLARSLVHFPSFRFAFGIETLGKAVYNLCKKSPFLEFVLLPFKNFEQKSLEEAVEMSALHLEFKAGARNKNCAQFVLIF